jgi:hypothetical protein
VDGKWSEVDPVTGEVREVELPDELAELVERAMVNEARPKYDPNDKMIRREQ